MLWDCGAIAEPGEFCVHGSAVAQHFFKMNHEARDVDTCWLVPAAKTEAFVHKITKLVCLHGGSITKVQQDLDRVRYNNIVLTALVEAKLPDNTRIQFCGVDANQTVSPSSIGDHKPYASAKDVIQREGYLRVTLEISADGRTCLEGGEFIVDDGKTLIVPGRLVFCPSFQSGRENCDV